MLLLSDTMCFPFKYSKNYWFHFNIRSRKDVQAVFTEHETHHDHISKALINKLRINLV
jgi:hypothetical protein